MTFYAMGCIFFMVIIVAIKLHEWSWNCKDNRQDAEDDEASNLIKKHSDQ